MEARTRTEENESERSKIVQQQQEKVAYYKLFSYADKKDVILMAVGLVAALGNGLMMPMMSFVFGQIIDAFGQSNKDNVVSAVSKVRVFLTYLQHSGWLAGWINFIRV